MRRIARESISQGVAKIFRREKSRSESLIDLKRRSDVGCSPLLSIQGYPKDLKHILQ